MLKERRTYKDYNGVERTEDFYFALSQSELIEMELTTAGSFTNQIESIINSKDVPTIVNTFKDLLLKSYGEKSADGKYFSKIDKDGKPLSIAFSQTPVYDEMYIELTTDAEKASRFVNGILPQALLDEAAKQGLDFTDIETVTAKGFNVLSQTPENPS